MIKIYKKNKKSNMKNIHELQKLESEILRLIEEALTKKVKELAKPAEKKTEQIIPSKFLVQTCE